MGFFCYRCKKKVRGQPSKHGCTRKKYGKDANRRVYDQSGNKGHRLPPSSRGFICFDLRDKGYCDRSNCCYSHKFQSSGEICNATRNGERCKNFNKCPHSHYNGRESHGEARGGVSELQSSEELAGAFDDLDINEQRCRKAG